MSVKKVTFKCCGDCMECKCSYKCLKLVGGKILRKGDIVTATITIAVKKGAKNG